MRPFALMVVNAGACRHRRSPLLSSGSKYYELNHDQSHTFNRWQGTSAIVSIRCIESYDLLLSVRETFSTRTLASTTQSM